MQYFAAHAQIIKGQNGQPQVQGIAVQNEKAKAKQRGRLMAKKRMMNAPTGKPLSGARPGMPNRPVAAVGGQQPEVAQQ